ncbi:MAG: hypothetical protein WC839_02170 [Candidatus Paceibacterota bacterium]
MEYKSENKICQNCKKDFTIEPEDFNFYKKIKVPPPTWCPECRLINRLINIIERTLYNDICDNCDKKIVSHFAPETPNKVFCSSCWWSDCWDGTQYGKDYNFNKTFFEQLHELRKIVPCPATNSRNSTNCNYCSGLIRCKNCTMVFGSIQSINCYYCSTALFAKDSIDSDFIINADHVYEGTHLSGVYNTKFTYFSDECLDSSFLFNCVGCSNCFGCINLRNQKYRIFNKQYTKEEYKKEIVKWDLGSYKILLEAQREFMELYYKTPRRFALITNSTNVLGDDIQNTKNCQICFSATHGVENCKFIFHGGLLLKDSYDVTLGGDTSELLYQVTGSTESQRALFTRASHHNINVEYSENTYNCSDCFGCVKLKYKKYCILNKQYTKEEYEELILKIKQHMNDMPYIDKKERIHKYGDYYPIEHAMWAYNESWAHQWFPLTKNQAIEKGFYWRDEVERDYKITIQAENLPNHINDVSDSILNEVIECEHNGKNCNQQCTIAFRILPNELEFYRQINIALPRLCPNCRHYERLKKTNPPKLWHRKCMCNGVESKDGIYKNTIKHIHGDEPCQNEFETAIGPDRKEIVYCEKCYQDEFI